MNDRELQLVNGILDRYAMSPQLREVLKSDLVKMLKDQLELAFDKGRLEQLNRIRKYLHEQS